MTYRRILAFYLLLAALLPLAAYSALIYRQTSDRVRQDALSVTERTVKSTMEGFERRLDDLYFSMLDAVSYPELTLYTQNTLSRANSSTAFHTADIVKAQLRAFLTASRANVRGLSLYLSSNTQYTYTLGTAKIQTYPSAAVEAMRCAGKPYWYIDYDSAPERNAYPVVLSCAYLSTVSSQAMGSVVLNVNPDVFSQSFNKKYWTDGEMYMLVDANNRVMMHPDESMMGKLIKDTTLLTALSTLGSHPTITRWQGESYVMFSQALSRTGWRALYLIPYRHFSTPSAIVARTALFIALPCALAAALIALALAYTISRPIVRLTAAMKENTSEALNRRAPECGPKELRILARTYNQLMTRVQELLIATERETQQKNDAEMAMLRAQIMPHFLYNTLNTIKCLAATGESDKVQLASTSLISLLRGSIGSPRSMITLREELDYVANYVVLQRLRLDLQFAYEVNVPSELMEHTVPRFILQPIVENALFHAFPVPDAHNRIEVSAELWGGALLLNVRDNGTGVDEQVQRALLDRFNGSSEYAFSKVGLVNVNERIRRQYGEEFGIRIHNLKDGLEVCIVLGVG